MPVLNSIKSDALSIKNIKDLFCNSTDAIVAVNILSSYRIIAAPILLILIGTGSLNLFRWLLLVSFLTDALDGFLARKLNAVTPIGAKLDSVGDLLTFSVAIVGLIITWPEFIRQECIVFAF